MGLRLQKCEDHIKFLEEVKNPKRKDLIENGHEFIKQSQVSGPPEQAERA